MAIWGILDLGKLWLDNGGDPHTVVAMVSICLAESSGNDQAISRSGDYGLWQINEIHFDPHVVTAAKMLQPGPNVQEAIRLSDDGSNVAAWCTAWVDPATNCGHGQLAFPQKGSPADSHVLLVLAELAGLAAAQSIAQAADDMNVGGGEWGQLQYTLGDWARSTHNHVTKLGNTIERLIT